MLASITYDYLNSVLMKIIKILISLIVLFISTYFVSFILSLVWMDLVGSLDIGLDGGWGFRHCSCGRAHLW